MATLTVKSVKKALKEETNDGKLLDFKKSKLSHVDDLSAFTDVQRINLAKNSIKDAKGLENCIGVRWINLSDNKLESLRFVSKMSDLTVLNCGSNQIEDISAVKKLMQLKALILNDNQISRPIGLKKLGNLNTLVLSQNKIQDIDVSHLVSLTKLQLSHNYLHTFPDISLNVHLKSLHLNDNNINKIAAECIGDNDKLEIIDLGKNQILKLEHVQLLSKLGQVRQLNMKGNPVVETENYLQTMLSMLPHVTVLDTRPRQRWLKKERSPKRSYRSEHRHRKRRSDDSHRRRERSPKRNRYDLYDQKERRSSKYEQRNGEESTNTKMDLVKEKQNVAGNSASVKSEEPKIHDDQNPKASADIHGVNPLKERKSGVLLVKDHKHNKKDSKTSDSSDIFTLLENVSSVGTGEDSAW